jgi:hypothetical protein
MLKCAREGEWAKAATRHAERIVFVLVTFSFSLGFFLYIYFPCWSSNCEAHTRIKKIDLRIKFSFPFRRFSFFSDKIYIYIFIAEFLRWIDSFVSYFLHFFFFFFFFYNHLYTPIRLKSVVYQWKKKEIVKLIIARLMRKRKRACWNIERYHREIDIPLMTDFSFIHLV